MLRITYLSPALRPCRIFYGHWPNTNARGLTTLVVEQVSHHPPITAYYIANPSRGVTLEGHNAQKTSFSGKVALSAAACTLVLNTVICQAEISL